MALNSVYDIRVLFLIDRGQSDAATMARLFLLPSWVWATAWMLMSVAMLGATLWMTRGRTVNRFSGWRDHTRTRSDASCAGEHRYETA